MISFVWVFLYFALHGLASLFPASYGPFLTIAAELPYWIALFLHLRRRNLLTEYGIRWPDLRRHYSVGILLVIPVLQCILCRRSACSVTEIPPLLLAAFAEEMGFRVLIPNLISARFDLSVRASVVFSSVMFALFHCVSAFAGDLIFSLLQMLYAFCAGCAFCAMTKGTKSVWPSFVLHALINLTAGDYASEGRLFLFTMLFSVLLAGYAGITIHKTQKGTASL